MSSMRFFKIDPKDPTVVLETDRCEPDQVVARFYGDDAKEYAASHCNARNNDEEVQMGEDL